MAEQLTVAAMEGLTTEAELKEQKPVLWGREVWHALREAPADLTKLDIDRSQFELRAIEL